MEKEFSALIHLRRVDPPAELQQKIWQAIKRRKEQTISLKAAAMAACFFLAVFSVEVYALIKPRSPINADFAASMQLTTQNDLYDE